MPVLLEYSPDAPTLVLSPHFDDAALSCWTLLSQDDVDVVVVNVFAGIPERGILGDWDRRTLALHDSGLGSRLRRRLRMASRTPDGDSARLIETRIVEDKCALAELGRECVNLDLLDRQYRAHPAYGLPDPTAAEILGELTRSVCRASAVFVPAGIAASGAEAHADHILVRSLIDELSRFSGPLHLYADLPYAARLGWPESIVPDGSVTATSAWYRCLESGGIDVARLSPDVRALSTGDRRRKEETLRRYETQWPALSYGEQELRFEVFWRMPGLSRTS